MLIDNFEEVEDFMRFQFEKGLFFKFEALVRNTDGNNELYEEGYSNTNKNILIKSWYIDSPEYYERAKKEMITLCNMTGARLYMTCDIKSCKKLIQTIVKEVNDMVLATLQGSEFGVKKLNKMFSHCTSVVASSEPSKKTLMFDVDTKDERALQIVRNYLNWKSNLCVRNHVDGFKYIILNTVKGYHVVATRKFDSSDWTEYATEGLFHVLSDKRSDERRVWVDENVSLKANQLCLVYANKEDKENER